MLKSIQKEYESPLFEFVGPDNCNRVFFAASGEAPSVGGSIKSMISTNASW